MVIFMTVAFHGISLTARGSAGGAIPLAPSYILPHLGGKLRGRIIWFGARCGMMGG